MLIGIAGRKGAGKTTVADALVVECDFKRLSFATPLKTMLGVFLECSGLSPVDVAYYATNKETVIGELGVSYWHLAQTLGTGWGRQQVHGSVWLQCADQAIRQCESDDIVFDDLRFENEAQFIRDRGGVVLHLRRPDAAVDTHASEQGLAILPDDLVVDNRGSVEDLLADAVSVLFCSAR